LLRKRKVNETLRKGVGKNLDTAPGAVKVHNPFAKPRFCLIAIGLKDTVKEKLIGLVKATGENPAFVGLKQEQGCKAGFRSEHCYEAKVPLSIPCLEPEVKA
jgi:hypothetical protein